MRILMTCQPALSHAAQLVPLAGALRERGHEVTLATSPSYAAMLEARGVSAEAVGPDFLLREGDPVYERTVGSRLFFGFIDLATRSTLDDLAGLARARKFDLVIREYAEFNGWMAARRLGLPVVTHGIMHRLPPPAVQRIIGELERPAREAGIHPPASEGELYGEAYIDIVPPSFRLPWEGDEPFLLASAPSGYEGAAGAGPDAQLSRLGTERPLLYVTLGTVFTHDPRVWATIREAVTDLEADVLVTVGPDTDEKVFSSVPAHVCVKRFVPQSQVLPHTAALVCHAGFNTLMGSFRAGVPSVCLPLNADQPLNARACAEAGAGINLANSPGDTRGAMVDPDTLSPRAVRGAIETILNDGAFALAAERLGHEIRSMPTAQQVAEAIELRMASAAV